MEAGQPSLSSIRRRPVSYDVFRLRQRSRWMPSDGHRGRRVRQGAVASLVGERADQLIITARADEGLETSA